MKLVSSSDAKLLWRWSVIALSLMPKRVLAKVACTSDAECQKLLGSRDTKCDEDGYCTNPFHAGGCLYQKGIVSQPRVCNSEDPPLAADLGYCRAPPLDYPEVRIAAGNWESSFAGAWIMQILLSELLGVPTTIETGEPNMDADFYDRDMSLDYGVGYPFDAIEKAAEVGDCRILPKADTTEDYQMCAHVMPEVWKGQYQNFMALAQEGKLEHPQSVGAIGGGGQHIMKFTLDQYPQLISYFGMAGEENRALLADVFRRPTTWGDYCSEESADNCTTADAHTQRAPANSDEAEMYFSEGDYTGFFRKTEENDCEANPTTCTGAFIDYPCGWSSWWHSQAHFLGIALKPTRYSYSAMLQIMLAANATKSHIVTKWWFPDTNYAKWVGTDSELYRLTLPPTTQECIEHRSQPEDRCNSDISEEERLGDPRGACDEPVETIYKLLSTRLYEMANDKSLPEALQSPAFEALDKYALSELQLSIILDNLGKREIDLNFDIRNITCEFVTDNLDYVKSFMPRGYPRVVQDKVEVISDPLFYVSLILAVVAFCAVVIVAAGVYRYRNKRVFALAQVEFLFFILLGLLLVTLGSVTLTLPPTDLTCIASASALSVGYTLELVPLLVKISAINRLMLAAAKMRRVEINKNNLRRMVAGLAFLAMAACIIWAIVDPRCKATEFDLSGETNPDEAHIVYRSHFCESESDIWEYASISWHGFLLFWATVLAFQTRKLPDDVNESKVLARLIYAQFLFLLLRAITVLLEQAIPVSDHARILAIIQSCDVLATCAIYFVPKLLDKNSPAMTKGSMVWSDGSARNSHKWETARGTGNGNSGASPQPNSWADMHSLFASRSGASGNLSEIDEVGEEDGDDTTNNLEPVFDEVALEQRQSNDVESPAAANLSSKISGRAGHQLDGNGDDDLNNIAAGLNRRNEPYVKQYGREQAFDPSPVSKSCPPSSPAEPEEKNSWLVNKGDEMKPDSGTALQPSAKTIAERIRERHRAKMCAAG